MTIANILNRISYDGTGALTPLAVSFPFHAQADLVVVETIIITGVQTTKTLTTHYTITGTTDALGYYSSGGTVTPVLAFPVTVRWTIYRDPARLQNLNLTENNNLPAESLEAAVDYQTMLIQRVADLIVRSLHQPDGDATSVGELPSAVSRASKYLAFNTSGDPIAADAFSSNPGSTVVSAYMATVLDDIDDTTARATLGASKTEPVDNVFRVVGSADSTKKLAFEVDGLTTGTTRTLTVQNEDGTLALTSEFDYANLAGSAGRVPFPAYWIQGLTFANNAGDATNDLDIAAGQCRDAENTHNLILAAMTKQSDFAWAVGTAAGMLDTGAVGNSDYYIWAIKRSDTGVCDILSSLSSTAPTMPASYTLKRLIGWFKRVGGTVVAMTTYEAEGGGLELNWTVPTLDVNLAATLTTTGRTDAVKVPLNFSTIAHLNVQMKDAGSGLNPAWIYNPDTTPAAPSLTVAPLGNIYNESGAGDAIHGLRIRTSSTGTIGAIALVATVDTYRVVTLGFTWARRNR